MFGTQTWHAGGASVAPHPRAAALAAAFKRRLACRCARLPAAHSDSPAPGSTAGSNAAAGTSVRSLYAGRSAARGRRRRGSGTARALWFIVVGAHGSCYLPRESSGRTRENVLPERLSKSRTRPRKAGLSSPEKGKETGKETVLEKTRKNQTIKNTPAAAVGAGSPQTLSTYGSVLPLGATFQSSSDAWSSQSPDICISELASGTESGK